MPARAANQPRAGSGGSLLGASPENPRPRLVEPRVRRPRQAAIPQQVHGFLKNDTPDSIESRECEGSDMQEIGDSFQSHLGLSERPPHCVGELHFIESGVEAAQIRWLVITHETQIPL
jgi:hypothetical protein